MVPVFQAGKILYLEPETIHLLRQHTEVVEHLAESVHVRQTHPGGPAGRRRVTK